MSDHELDDFIRHQLALPGEPLWQRVTSALIRHAMAHCDDNQSQAAALLGIEAGIPCAPSSLTSG